MARIVKFLDNDFVHHAQIQNIQTQIANLKSHTPSFAFHSEPHANAQTTLPLYSISQDTLQSSTAANLVELHASLLVVQDVQSAWPKVRKGNPPGSNNSTSISFSNSISTKESATSNVGK